VALDHLCVQVGGGALGSAVAQAVDEAIALGALGYAPRDVRRPRMHFVQTQGAWPLGRAYAKITDAILERLAMAGAGSIASSPPPSPSPPSSGSLSSPPSSPSSIPTDPEARARRIATAANEHEHGAILAAVFAEAAHHRGRYMWPWETPPHSIAHGILDDETYDWRALVEAMARSGGRAVVVDEDTLAAANRAANAHRAGAIEVDETGTSGLAGVLALRRDGVIRDGDEVAVILSGARR
jgi:hypothetical protein